MSVSDDPNAGQRKFWRNADIWVQQQERFDRQLAHIGLAAMDVATELSPAAHVLDVGCGCGQTSLQWSERVTGSVLGVDISDLLIDVARQRAATHAAEHSAAAPISFVVADAQTADMTALAAQATGRNGACGGFDVVFSRFGVMFFADPAAAFANVRAATRSGGQLAFACWQTPRQNPWLITVNKAVLEVVEMPEGDGPTVDPFAFADTDFVRGVLSDAGWSAVDFESFETEMIYGAGSTLADTAQFAMDLGIAQRALEGHPPAVHAQAKDAVIAALSPFATPAGVVFPAAAWIVTARN